MQPHPSPMGDTIQSIFHSAVPSILDTLPIPGIKKILDTVFKTYVSSRMVLVQELVHSPSELVPQFSSAG